MDSNIICKICNQNFKNKKALATHVNSKHSMKSKEYYDLYCKTENEGICKTCGNETSWRGKYLKYCSNKCLINSPEFIDKIKSTNIGRKQSADTIEKRIKNTNQTKKELARQSTLIEKYGTLNTCDSLDAEQLQKRNDKISIGHKNKKHTKEHHEKIIESKERNNTLNHSEETKQKISDSLKEYYQTNSDVSVNVSNKFTTNNKKGYITGKINEIFYRSSYEKIFIEYCVKNNIKIQSAESKDFRLEYYIDNKRHYYYPDFYLPDFNVIVEVKPLSMLDVNNNQEKIHEGLTQYKFLLITEEELENLDECFLYLD